MTITINTATDAPLKRDIVEMAFGDLAMSGYEFGRTPEEVKDALNRLDALMSEWPFDQLGYLQADYGAGSGEDSSGIARKHLRAVAGSLALDLAGMMGTTLAKEPAARIAQAVSRLYSSSEVAVIPTMPHSSGTPAGAGSRGRTFVRSFPVEEVDTTDPGDLAGLIP